MLSGYLDGEIIPNLDEAMKDINVAINEKRKLFKNKNLKMLFAHKKVKKITEEQKKKEKKQKRGIGLLESVS